MIAVHDDGANFNLDDDDFAAEEGCSPAMLGGFMVPQEVADAKLTEPRRVDDPLMSEDEASNNPEQKTSDKDSDGNEVYDIKMLD